MAPLLAWLMVVVGYAAPIDEGRLERFLDQTVPERLEAAGVPGVLVAVVHGDRAVLVKGWGLADVEQGRTMDGERTIFRVASISKTFTATAIAQLEEQGRVDLDAPVDSYLTGLTLPPRYETPVTLRHLLTHTGGFINHNIGRVSRAPSPESFAQFMARTMAPQVYPPGRVVLYTNHGLALAGLVVEQVYGEPFADAMQARVLEPLQMNDSRFGLDPAAADRLATGYMIEDGAASPYEYLYVHTTPASGLHTTAADMARFMILHLGRGQVDDEVVLQPDTVQRMRARTRGLDPALSGFHYAFVHGHMAGHPARRHGGSVPGFQSRMVLFDEHALGIFVGHNAYGVKLRDELAEAIAAELLPEPEPAPSVVPAGDGRPVDPAAVVGAYQPTSIRDTPGLARAHTILAQSAREVALDEQGFLTVDGARFVRTGALVFHREREGQRPQALVFVRDATGQVRWMHLDRHSAQRRPWHAAPGVQWLLWGGVLLVLVVASSGARVLWRLSPPARRQLSMSVAAARLVLLGTAVPLLYAAWLDQGQPPLMRPLRFGMPRWLVPLRWLTVVGGGLALFAAVRAWRDRGDEGSSGAVRAGALVVALAVAAQWLLELYWSTPAPGLLRT